MVTILLSVCIPKHEFVNLEYIKFTLKNKTPTKEHLKITTLHSKTHKNT